MQAKLMIHSINNNFSIVGDPQGNINWMNASWASVCLFSAVCINNYLVSPRTNTHKKQTHPVCSGLAKENYCKQQNKKKKTTKKQNNTIQNLSEGKSSLEENNLKTVILNGSGLLLHVFMWNALWQTGARKFGSASKSGMLLGKKINLLSGFSLFQCYPLVIQ